MISLPNIANGEDKSSPLTNRIRKNYRHIRKWAKRTDTDCFRIYDKEIREYPVAIDFYGGRFCIHYFSKSREIEDPDPQMIKTVEQSLRVVFGEEAKSIYWRTRAKHKETRQYEKTGESKEFFVVHEYGVKFKVNLVDYLDTGLFLDHRETRKYVADHAEGKSLLNLFAYTSSFSVQAAAAGAKFTKSVDMSNTYTAWGKDNFILNGFPLKNNEVVRADCLKFLDDEVKKGLKYDIVVIDPPTISRSKKMDQLFDIQIDYIQLIKKSVKLINDDGVIYFSTNYRKFALDESFFPECHFSEITNITVPIDFKDSKIHRCWKLTLH